MPKDSRGGKGESLSNDGGKNIQIEEAQDVWSFRHDKNNERFVDEINTGVRRIQSDFSDIMENTVYTVEAVKYGKKDFNTLGTYGNGAVGINKAYTNIDQMNRVYDAGVGHHPNRGNKSAVEAVTLHEMGHALSDNIAKKLGLKDLQDASKKIVDDAYKSVSGKGGTKKWAGTISKYAQSSYAECVAEAVCDYYCNGNKASKASIAIMKTMRKYK